MRFPRTEAVPLPPLVWRPEQTAAFFAALSWWQEGERALDYLAESAARSLVFDKLRLALQTFRTDPNAQSVRPVLLQTRHLTENRALHRTLFTDAFARSLHTLLYGDGPLFARLTAFLQTAHVGSQTAAHLLFGAFPDRYPLLSRATLVVIAASPAQTKAARARAAALYGSDAENSGSREARVLLGQFVLYEDVQSVLQTDSFDTLHCILFHSSERPAAPKQGSRRKKNAAVLAKETASGYNAAPSGANAGDKTDAPAPTETDLLDLIEREIADAGFTFAPLVIRRYYVALKAKPFVILSGLSGTGKTRLTNLFARALCGKEAAREQYLLVPVRPDWTSGDALLGYHNLLTGLYVTTPFLTLLQKANMQENQNRAFFVCLDEMNLARVEHYFSDLLSAMETEDGHIPLHENTRAVLPPNVFLTGSVNMDEATHPFSRKVLDRANTIEFSRVSLAGVSPPFQALSDVPHIAPQMRQALFFQGRVSSVSEAKKRMEAADPGRYGRVVQTLSALNDLLAPRQMHVGYRVRDEVLRYVAAAFDINGNGLFDAGDAHKNERLALDTQIIQKILPRIGGPTESLSRLLETVQTWAQAAGFSESAAKLAAMQERGEETGLVSFYD